mgnify:CR=1 FL=1
MGKEGGGVASRIQGITVEIGGDIPKFTTALKWYNINEREFWLGLSKICYAKDIAEMAIRQLDRLRKWAQGGAAL